MLSSTSVFHGVLTAHTAVWLTWEQLLNYLDRGNIGAARIMNEETGDSLLQVTGITTQGYAVAVSVFR